VCIPAALSLTNLTECGLRYSGDETRALASLAKARGLKVHLDGARFTNALVGGTESAADLTWKAGVDVLCLGATKNGALAAEAVIFFDPAMAETASYRRMRGGHLLSKGRFLSAQMEGWLADDHWLSLASHANRVAARLAKGLAKVHGIRLAWPVEGNEVFIILPTWLEQDLLEAGFRFYRWKTASLLPRNAPRENDALCRLVCSWQTHDGDIDNLIKVATDASAAGR
jgi:threonine aldolase